MNTTELLLIILLLVLVVLAMRRVGSGRGDKSRAARLMKQYRHMTMEKLQNIPEGELVDAVVSRVLAYAAESKAPNIEKTLTDLGHGSTVVYTVWAVCKEMAAGGYDALSRTATWALADKAAEHFRGIGAAACGDAWEALYTDGAAEAEEAFHRAVEQEQPLGLCEEFIRDNATAFLDEPVDVSTEG